MEMDMDMEMDIYMFIDIDMYISQDMDINNDVDMDKDMCMVLYMDMEIAQYPVSKCTEVLYSLPSPLRYPPPPLPTYFQVRL